MIDVVNAGYRIGGATLVSGVTAQLHPGTFTALVGPNGAGKSTLLGLLAGDLEPSEGQVRLGDTPVRRWNSRALARVRAVMLQQHATHFGFSVREAVAMGRTPHDVDVENDARIVDAALAEVELGPLADRDITTLSGGESARSAFARTVTQQAEVLLLDEPTAALDLRAQEVLLAAVRRRRDAGACVVVVLHDLNQAARYADHLIVMRDGDVVTTGPPGDVITAQLVEEVFGLRALVVPDPVTGTPTVVALDPRAAPPRPVEPDTHRAADPG